jgi:hypothetical protein
VVRWECWFINLGTRPAALASDVVAIGCCSESNSLSVRPSYLESLVSLVLNRVLGIQRHESTGACTLFLLQRRLSAEETMSTRLTHDLWCNWTDELTRRLL